MPFSFINIWNMQAQQMQSRNVLPDMIPCGKHQKTSSQQHCSSCVPDRTLQPTGCNSIHSLRQKTQETTNKRNMSNKQCRKTATKRTRSSLTSGCAFKSSKKDLKKSERSTCLGATHSVSMSAPAAKPHTVQYTQHSNIL